MRTLAVWIMSNWIWLLASAVATAVVSITAVAMSLPIGKCSKAHLWVGWVMERLELCRLLYIRSRRPQRIILMRHAESEGNVNKELYTSTPDHALKITERGRRQAAEAGSELKELIGDESVYFMVSPYTRTRMTYDIVRETLDPKQWATKEDPRLRELDFGNFQDLATMKETMETRKAYGRFWFRFMNGESGADVYDRATAFWESVFRSMDNATADSRFQNYVIVTHGLMMRLILMRYFQWKVEYFEHVCNADNCETWVMERDERGGFRLVTEIPNRPALSGADNLGPDSPGVENDSECDAITAAAAAGESGAGARGMGQEDGLAGIGGRQGNRDTFIQQIDKESVEVSTKNGSRRTNLSAGDNEFSGEPAHEIEVLDGAVCFAQDLDSDEPATPPVRIAERSSTAMDATGLEEFIGEEDTAEAVVTGHR